MKLSLLPFAVATAATILEQQTLSSTTPGAPELPTESVPKLNLTAATTVNDVAVIQCWQLDLQTPPLHHQAAVGYRIGNFVNTTITAAPDTHFPGVLAESYSLLTIIKGAIEVPSANYTLKPGRDSTLITAIKGPGSPTGFGTVIKGPLYVVQQYTDTIPEHTVLYEGACKEKDLPQ